MKSLKTGMLAALLVPVGIGTAVFGFWPSDPALRTGLQVGGIVIAAVGIYLGQQLAQHWEKMLDNA